MREWAGALVTGGILDYDPADRTYSLPAEHAACLTGGGATNLAPVSQIVGAAGAARPRGRPRVPRGRRRALLRVPARVHRRDGRARPRALRRAAGRRDPAAGPRAAGVPRGRRPRRRHRLRHRPLHERARPRLPAVAVRRLRPGRGRDRPRADGGRGLGPGQRHVRGARRRRPPARASTRSSAFDVIHDQRDPRGRAAQRARRARARRLVPHEGRARVQRPRGQPRQPVRGDDVRRQHAALHDGLAGRGRGRPGHHVGRAAGLPHARRGRASSTPRCTRLPATRMDSVYVSRRA